jgi:hypothetical protein
MPRMTKAQLADFAADAVALSKEHADRAGGMTPPPGKFAVTIRVERPDGQFVTSSRLIPGDLLIRPEPDLAQEIVTDHIADAFVAAYRRAAELAE